MTTNVPEVAVRTLRLLAWVTIAGILTSWDIEFDCDCRHTLTPDWHWRIFIFWEK